MFDRFIGYIVSAERGHQKIIEVMMLIKIIGESVKFIGSKFIQESHIDMSLQLYISYKLIVTLHHVSLRLLQSVNTLNSKLNSNNNKVFIHQKIKIHIFCYK